VRLTEPAALLKGLGFDFWLPPIPAVLGEVLAGGPGALAGLKAGDKIVAIQGQPVSDFRDIANRVSSRPGETLDITYSRAGSETTVPVHVASESVGGKLVGRIQVGQVRNLTLPDSMVLQIQLSPGAALSRAAQEAWSMTAIQGRLFWRMVLGQFSMKNLNGPLSIAEYAGDSAEAGVASFLSFLVLISLSLGFLNLLPIPILDGGQIVFQLVEWLKGSPLSERAQAFGQQVGIALLILLMGVALFNDIARQLS
jgi:regulator of sigma E protease